MVSGNCCLGRQLDRFPDTKHFWGRLQFSQPKSPQWSNLALAKIIKALWYATCTWISTFNLVGVYFFPSKFEHQRLGGLNSPRGSLGIHQGKTTFGGALRVCNLWYSNGCLMSFEDAKTLWKPSKLLGSCEIQPSLMRNSHTTEVVQLFAKQTQLSLDGLSPIISASHHEWLCPEN